MDGTLQIAVDLEQGEIRLGPERIRLLPVAGDVFCLNDTRGPLVRALKFDERSQLLGGVSDKDIASLVADAALISAGVVPDEVRIAASLALAGGGEQAPAFPECVRFVEQHYGWDEKRVGETMALAVDKLCREMVQQDSNGWKQIVFQKSDADLGTLITQMATNLSQRAGAASDSNVHSVTTDKKQPQSSSHRPSHSTNNSQFESQNPSPASRGSIQSVSSVFPGKRVAARVLALNTDRPAHAERAVVMTAEGDAEPKSPEFTSPKPNQVLRAQPMPRPTPMSATIPAASQRVDFPMTANAHTSHTNFSLLQPAVLARTESLTGLPPVATFPCWQPFTASSANTKPSSEPARTNSSAFGVAAREPLSPHDWLAEVAQLLEAECDIRGIDP